MYNKIKKVLFRVSIGSLSWRDIIERSVLRLFDRLRSNYFAASALLDTMHFLGISTEEALSRAADAVSTHKASWNSRERCNERDILSFYNEDDNYLFTLPLHWRINTWHFVQRLSPGKRILEYGCGTACMTKWLLKRYPKNEYTVADLAIAATMPFVRYRFRSSPVRILEIGQGREGLPLHEKYDFISCVEVLEHCFDTMMFIEHLYDHLDKGGILYITYPIDREQLEKGHTSENLRESALHRDHVLGFLENKCFALKSVRPLVIGLDSIWGWDALGIYRKE